MRSFIPLAPSTKIPLEPPTKDQYIVCVHKPAEGRLPERVMLCGYNDIAYVLARDGAGARETSRYQNDGRELLRGFLEHGFQSAEPASRVVERYPWLEFAFLERQPRDTIYYDVPDGCLLVTPYADAVGIWRSEGGQLVNIT